MEDIEEKLFSKAAWMWQRRWKRYIFNYFKKQIHLYENYQFKYKYFLLFFMKKNIYYSIKWVEEFVLEVSVELIVEIL